MLETHWRPVGAQTSDTWFIIGDVHGQWDAYKTLLKRFATFNGAGVRNLVTLGDLIDKGPASVKCLKATLSDKAKTLAQADVHHKLWGNHEIMMVEAMRALDTEMFNARMNIWRLSGADGMLAEVQEKGSDKKRLKKLIAKIGVDSLSDFQSWKGTLTAPGLRFAHAGFCPTVGFERTSTLHPSDLWRLEDGKLVKHRNHWASIRKPFLIHRGKWPALVFHGHSIPRKLFFQKPQRAVDVVHTLDNKNSHGRICLDAGAGKSFGVAGAIVFNGQYKLVYIPINRFG